MIFLGIAIISAILAAVIVNGVYNVYFQTEEKGWGDE